MPLIYVLPMDATVNLRYLRVRTFVLFVLCFCLVDVAYSKPIPRGKPYQKGMATYYSSRMHGHKMSDGTTYSKYHYTCAHRTLPFGTMLRVVNLRNGLTTDVRVADRGPFGKGLIVDLSNSAASKLRMISAGVVPVHIYIIPSTKPIFEQEPFIKDPEYLHYFDSGMDSPEVRTELEWGPVLPTPLLLFPTIRQ